MVFHLLLCQLKPGVTPAEVDAMMRQTRTQLLKISEVKIIRCGQRIETRDEWGFFLSLEFESMEKLASYRAHPVSQRHREEVLEPHVWAMSEYNFELEPGRDPRHS